MPFFCFPSDTVSSPKVISRPNTISKYDYKYSEYSSLVEEGIKYNSENLELKNKTKMV